MKKYKITAILLALTLVLTLGFVGCGKPGKDDSSSSISSSSTGGGTQSTPNPDREVSIYLIDSISLQEYTAANISFEIVGANASEIVWTSSDDSVAKVDKNGRVSGVSVGSVTITATVGKVSATCEVTVSKNTSFPVLDLSQDEVMPRVGGSVKVTARILFNGAFQDFSNFSWTSKNPDVATVSNGEIVGVSVGETVVYVSAEYNGVLLEEEIIVKVVKGPNA